MRKLALLIALLAPAAGLAETAEEPASAPRKMLEADTSRNYLRLAFNFYEQTDGGGNRNVNEDMQVVEPQLLLGLGLTEKLSLSVKMQGGLVSAASTNSGAGGTTGGTGGTGDDEDEDEDDEAVSGASGDDDEGGNPLTDGDPFFGIEGGLFYAWSDRIGTGIGVTYNQEETYRSIGGNARFVYTTPDKNDTFSIKGSATFDTIDVRYFDGTGGGSESRNSFAVGLGWTHVLGRRTQMTLNYDFTFQDGLLSTPYNSVLIDGTEVREELPDSRMRHALFGRIRHLLFETLAVEPGLGLYADDWGAMAASVELRGFWEFVPGVLILQPMYRFHWQREIDFFTDTSGPGIPDYRTQDSDLATFTNHTLGIKLVAPSVKIFGVDTELEFGGDYTFRSDRLNSFTLTAGLLVRF